MSGGVSFGLFRRVLRGVLCGNGACSGRAGLRSKSNSASKSESTSKFGTVCLLLCVIVVSLSAASEVCVSSTMAGLEKFQEGPAF